MRNILSLAVLLAFVSCAHVEDSKTQRDLSAESRDCMNFFKNIDLGSQRIISEADNTRMASHIKKCSESYEALEDLDRFMYVKLHGDEVWLKTLHGNVYLYKNDVLSQVDMKFPVASFEIVGDKMNFYNANDEARFCTFQMLDTVKPNKRNVSCSKVSYTLDLKK